MVEFTVKNRLLSSIVTASIPSFQGMRIHLSRDATISQLDCKSLDWYMRAGMKTNASYKSFASNIMILQIEVLVSA